MLEVYPELHLYHGASAVLDIDLSEFDFQNGKVIFTIKARGQDTPILEEEFSTAEVHSVSFSDSLCANLAVGVGLYEYDLMWVVDGKRFPQCAPSPVTVHHTVGGVRHED